jgi:hypothetical protein
MLATRASMTNWSNAVFMGSGLFAAQSPGMTERLTAPA